MFRMCRERRVCSCLRILKSTMTGPSGMQNTTPTCNANCSWPSFMCFFCGLVQPTAQVAPVECLESYLEGQRGLVAKSSQGSDASKTAHVTHMLECHKYFICKDLRGGKELHSKHKRHQTAFLKVVKQVQPLTSHIQRARNQKLHAGIQDVAGAS